MPKSILMSIQPKWVCEILNGCKTIEIRRKFPKDYEGWVYIYCTKGGQELNYHILTKIILGKTDLTCYRLNGKVPFRFWCDKVEEIETTYDEYRWGEEDYLTNELNPDELYEQSCLDFEQLNDYLKGKKGYAIHISKLEVFDEPRELSEFKVYNKYANPYLMNLYIPLTKAPQNYCYVEGEE